MTAHGPGGSPQPFSPSELDDATGIAPEESAGAARVARDLEALAARTPVATSPDFADRVMGAIAAEPAPAPARVATRALRHGAIGAFLLSLRDAWRVTIGSGFPMAARAQAFALVLVFAVLATGSGVVTAGALGLLGDADRSPAPSVEPSSDPAQRSPTTSTDPSWSPDASHEPSPSTSPDPSASADPSASPGETEDPEGTERPEGTDDSGGDDETAGPTETPDDDDDHTPSPTETPDDTPEPSRTPRPSETPRPSDTPDPSDDPED